MTRAATGRLVLTLGGAVAIIAGLSVVALISVVLGDPEQVVVATGQGDLTGVATLILERLTSAAVALFRYLL